MLLKKIINQLLSFKVVHM